MTKLENEIAELELIKVSFHEASHAALSRHFGGQAEARIWRNLGHLERGEIAWAGNCESAFLETPRTLQQDRLICIAGLIGQELMFSKMHGNSLEEFQHEIGDWLYSVIEAGEMSETDMAGIDQDVSDDDIAEVVSVLITSYDQIESEAIDLISQAKNSSSTKRKVFFLKSKKKVLENIPISNIEGIDSFFKI